MQKEYEIREQFGELEEQLAELLSESKEDIAKSHPLSMSSAAVSIQDLERFQTFMESSEFRDPTRLRLERSTITSGPGPLAIPVSETIAIWCRREPVMPGWVADFVAVREFWGSCALVICGESGATEYWKVVYAIQAPHPYLAVCRLEPVKITPDALPAGSSAGVIARSRVALSFKCNYGRFATAADMKVASLKDISIVFELRHVGGTIVTSSEEPVPIMHFMSGKPTPKAAPKEKTAASIEEAKDKVFEDIVLSMPWLQHLDDSQGFVGVVQKTMKKTAAASVPLPVVELDDEELMDALADVEKCKGEEVAIALERGTSDFKTHECHGESNVLKGAAYHDAVQGICETKEADAWSRKRKMQITFKMTFLMHTERVSRIVVRAWVHRMQFFFDYEMSNAGPGFSFTPEVLSKYEEPDELRNLLAEGKMKGETLKRIAVLRSIAPK